MGMTEQTAITIRVPLHQVGALKELLKAHPALQFSSRGWLVQKFAIVGSPAEIEALRAQLPAWQEDQFSTDAW